MVAGYELLRLKDHDDLITQFVAEKIIAIARLRIEDQMAEPDAGHLPVRFDESRVFNLVLKELGCYRAA